MYQMLRVAVALSSSDDNAVRCVLPVLWMTSCFPMTGYMARDVSNIDVGAVLKQVVRISNVSTTGATLFHLVVVYNGRKLRIGGEV